MAPLPKRFGREHETCLSSSAGGGGGGGGGGGATRTTTESRKRSNHKSSTGVRSWVIAGLLVAAAVAWAGYSYTLVARRESFQPASAFADGTVDFKRGAPDDAPVVAYVISLTHLDEGPSSFLDAAEVLLRSIRRVCSVSIYACEPIAFVLPKVSDEGRRLLEEIGWRTMEKDLPVAVEDIVDDFYRGFVVNSGCCGADEFVKLHAYTLTEYHRVLHLDVDTLLLHPMDELMEAEASLLYTTDPAMASKTQKAMPVQGGFLLVEPNMVVFDRLCDVVRKGNWRKMTGWEGSNIGWFYGGATIQGLLPYFYHILAPGMALEINRCIYNHMCDSVECRAPRYAVITELQQPQQVLVGTIVNTVGASGDGGKGENTRIRGDVQGALDTHSHEDAIADGDVVEISPIKSVHFTQQCPKPWGCRGGAGIHPVSACADLQKMWFDGRKAAFDARGVSFTGACKNGQYSPLPRDTGDIIA